MNFIQPSPGAFAQDARLASPESTAPAALSPALQAAPVPVPVPVPAPVPLDRTQILDATALVLRGHGYDGTTIRRIADQLDCAVGSIYRHFKDKRELLDAVCQRRFETVATHAEMGTPVARCASLYARAAADQPELYRLMFWLACVGQAPAAQGLPKVIARLVAAWGAQFDQPSDAGRFWAQLHGAMMQGLSPDDAMLALGLVRPQEAALETFAAQPARADHALATA